MRCIVLHRSEMTDKAQSCSGVINFELGLDWNTELSVSPIKDLSYFSNSAE